MFHCHLLQHEDAGMMGQFVVVRPRMDGGTALGHSAHAAAATHKVPDQRTDGRGQ